jgi:hypothetical protein
MSVKSSCQQASGTSKLLVSAFFWYQQSLQCQQASVRCQHPEHNTESTDETRSETRDELPNFCSLDIWYSHTFVGLFELFRRPGECPNKATGSNYNQIAVLQQQDDDEIEE